MKKRIFVLLMAVILYQMSVAVADEPKSVDGFSGVGKLASAPIEPVAKGPSPPIEPVATNFSSLIGPAVSSTPDSTSPPLLLMNIMDKAKTEGNLTNFVSFIGTTELADTLSRDGPFTLFAPTNDAFRKLPEATRQEILNNKTKLSEILRFHIAMGTIMSYDLNEGMELMTLHGMPLTVNFKDGNLIINGTKVGKSDIICSNGVIHEIDNVMMPIFNGKFSDGLNFGLIPVTSVDGLSQDYDPVAQVAHTQNMNDRIGIANAAFNTGHSLQG
jgi:hypothetical protein